MRIFYITDIFPAISQIFISREILELESRGGDVVVFSLYVPREIVKHQINAFLRAKVFYGQEFKAGKIRKALHHLKYLLKSPFKYFNTYRISTVKALPGLRYKFSQLPLICDKVQSFNPDRIHCHFGREGMLYGWMLSKMMGIPFSVTLHGSDVLVDPYENLGFVLKDADNVICVSQKIKNVISDQFSVSKEQIYVIRCGIDPCEFTPNAPLPNRLKILCIARLHPVKGLSFLVGACAALKEKKVPFECVIYGEGSQREELLNLIDQLELTEFVKLPGAIANENLPSIYSQHSLFILPSLSEGVPVVLMEAMASGLPLVATKVGGIPELVENNVNGFLVEPGNPKELAKAIERINHLGDEKIQQMRKLNRLKVEKFFNLGKEISKLYDLFFV